MADHYDHAKMARRIRRWLPPVGGSSVGTLATTVEVDHRTMARILAAAEVNGDEVAEAERDRLRTALELIEADGCSNDVEGVDLLCSEIDPDRSGWCAGCIAHAALGGTRG